MPTAPPQPGPSSRFDGRIDAVVHVGFAVLMVASGVRYVMRHSPADNLWTVALAAAVCGLYAITALLAHRRPARGSHWIPWMIALVAAWAALVIVAPSFAWCSFAIFFLARRAFRGWAGYAASSVTAAATAVGLFRMSGWTDVAMLLGPLAAGALLTLIYDKIERDQEQLAATERQAGIATERERVSREIHDTVTQGLASSLLLLEAAQRSWPDGSAQRDVAKAASLLGGTSPTPAAWCTNFPRRASNQARFLKPCSTPRANMWIPSRSTSPAMNGRSPQRSAMP